MSFSFRKLRYLVVFATGVALLGPVSAGAADLVQGYRAKPAAKVYHQRVVRTSYVRRDIRECSLLRVTEWEASRIVQVCYPPLDLRPPRSATSSSGEFAASTSYAVTQ